MGGTFHFYSNFKRNFFFANGGERKKAASDLVLHCFQMSHTKDDRLIWGNFTGQIFVVDFSVVKAQNITSLAWRLPNLYNVSSH